MAKRTARPSSPKREESEQAETAEPARPKIKRSRTPGDEPAEIANDSATGSASESGGPSEDDIRDRAYHRYLQRGGGHGMDFDDWLEAERELKTQK